ncbi:MAG TPA: hypothetical protein VN802_09430 [Stellaceae bacterium]|nr:hypothetical protein [Stellaceae bacterium]
MRNTTDIYEPSLASFVPAAHRSGGLPRPLCVLAGAAAALLALAFLFASKPPGAAIRADLVAAATSVRALPALASADEVRAAVEASFAGRPVGVDSAAFPAMVAVTLHDVDRQSCIAAANGARRIEGAVVIELDAYLAPDQCGARNDMTWRLMP